MPSEDGGGDRIASPRELAEVFEKADMPVWDLDLDSTLPTNSEWVTLGEGHLPTLRIALVTMTKTKDELLRMLRGMGGATAEDRTVFEDVIDRLHNSQELFDGWVKLLTAAEARLVGAQCKIAVEEGWADDQDDELARAKIIPFPDRSR